MRHQLQKQFDYAINLLNKLLFIDLPNYGEWELKRIDLAAIKKVKDIDKYFRLLKHSYYPRREKSKTEYHHSMSWGGSENTQTMVRCYDKHQDFKAHDYKRLKWTNKKKADRLLEFSKNIVRWEVEIKTKYIRKIFKKAESRKIKNIDMDKLIDIYNKEVFKVLKIREGEKVYSSYLEVEKRLMENCTRGMAITCLSLWFQLSAVRNDKEVLNTYKRSTFYRNRKILTDLNITWKTELINTNEMTCFDMSNSILNKPSYIIREKLAA